MREEELRARFNGLRESERETAPEFRSMVDSASQRLERHNYPTRGSRAWLPLAVAAAVVLGVAFSFRAWHGRQRIQSLATWRSPTAALLPQSADALQSPDLFRSVIDTGIDNAVSPTGD